MATNLQTIDAVGVSSERVEAFARLRVPDLDEVVIGARDDHLSVVLHAPDRGQMADQNAQAAPVGDGPHA